MVLQEAYAVLSDDETRAAYRSHLLPLSALPSSAPAPVQKETR